MKIIIFTFLIPQQKLTNLPITQKSKEKNPGQTVTFPELCLLIKNTLKPVRKIEYDFTTDWLKQHPNKTLLAQK